MTHIIACALFCDGFERHDLPAQRAMLRKALRSGSDVERFGVEVRDRLLVELLSNRDS
jgi:hypothetical protein